MTRDAEGRVATSPVQQLLCVRERAALALFAAFAHGAINDVSAALFKIAFADGFKQCAAAATA